MTAVAPANLKRLMISVILYMMIALIAGMIAILENLPAQFGGSRTGLTATQDFLYGMGTALSPPFYALIIQFGLLMLVPRKDRWGTLGVLGLTLIGLMTCIGALGEPINRRIFNPATFDPVKALIMVGMILIPLVIVIFGLMEWARRRREI
jgi:hypothetical protein